MNVTIPVHPISRKIISTRYPSLTINARDLLYHQLIYQNKKTKSDKKLTKLLTTSIEMELDFQPSIHAGNYLYKTHISEWLEFIWSQYILSKGTHQDITAISSLKAFARINNIDIDDIEFDSVYRQWLRYRDNREKHDISRYYFNSIVTQNIGIYHASTPAGAEKIIAPIVADNINLFFSDRWKNFKQDLVKSFQLFIMYYHGKLTQKQLSKIFNRTQSTINEKIGRFQSFLNKHPSLKEAVYSL